jgi:hypothetical protein
LFRFREGFCGRERIGFAASGRAVTIVPVPRYFGHFRQSWSEHNSLALGVLWFYGDMREHLRERLASSVSHLNLPDTAKVSVSKEQVSCNLAGEAAILNLKNGVYYGLNPVGARIWSLIQEPRTIKEIRDTLLNEYDVDASSLQADLDVLLGQLAENGLIEYPE